jgi:hypothetical protein
VKAADPPRGPGYRLPAAAGGGLHGSDARGVAALRRR